MRRVCWFETVQSAASWLSPSLSIIRAAQSHERRHSHQRSVPAHYKNKRPRYIVAMSAVCTSEYDPASDLLVESPDPRTRNLLTGPKPV